MTPNPSNAVVAHIQGGLGNQLFCYAAARAMALRAGLPLALNTRSGFRNEKYQREYLLGFFNIQAQEAGAWQAYIGPFGRTRRSLQVKRDAKRPIPERGIIKQHSDQRYIPELVDLRPTQSVYLLGYWQDERYFMDERETLRNDFTLADDAPFEPDPQLDVLTRQPNRVSVHLRSYSEAAVLKDGVRLDSTYYGPAMDRMRQQLDDARFIVFSDKPDWAEQIINELGHADRCTFAKPASADSTTATLTDFSLMARCKHHIIANSSFSWWAAWLGEREGSRIIAPPCGLLGSGRGFPDRWLEHDDD